MAIGGLLSGGLSLFAGLSAKSDAKRIGRLNVRAIEEETQESMRRARREFRNVIGAAEARTGSSGLSPQSGSFKAFIADQQAEADKQLAFIRKSGESQKRLAKAGASSAGRQALFQGIKGAVSGISSFVSGMGS